MKLGYLYGMKIKGSVDLGTDPYTGLPSTLHAPGGITPRIAANIFFVDGFNGDNDNNGLSRDTPFLTITYALTQCDDGTDDVIFVMDAWNTEPAYPIVVNKSRVHIIGLSNPQMGGKYVAMIPVGDYAMFQIGYSGCGSEIAGFSLGGGATNPCIMLGPTTLMDAWIHDCWFGNQYHLGASVPQDGIRNTGANATNTLIEGCRFFGSPGPGVGGITRYGVYNFSGGASFRNSAIVQNRFHCMSYAIYLTFATDFLVEHNYIMCPSDDAVGRGIYLNGATGGIIANNKAGDNGTADMTESPYYDDGAANNAWLCNQNGKTYVHPAVAL